MRRPPRLYFSLRSPFSWMAVRLLEERLPDADRLIEYVPFTEPDEQSLTELKARGGEFHYVAMSKAKHLYILSDTKRLAAKHGFAMKWPIDTGAEWWELPHLGWLKARELGVHREYYRAVMAARWERGEDICDREQLRRVCNEAGLDGDVLVSAPEDPAIREQGVQALMDVYEDDVFGVPYFRLGRHRFWGLDRLDDFVTALEQQLAVTAAKE
ncbi:2-hydroxychromene-2-carboxylate isomerase [Streptomyces broussonetiae]|uniref:2-hydroxychromene-2-carboxylate isomerase n=1 Tax=Streptomyces broussonetiae TaxID=2686304 RepID=A0A6I6NEZ7_9ACTN|nr:DsbA family protein [Streptomyces broussonetiae]QHA06597.1 disulfide bond formation protein DsbA [Streptomyces broussonetiae]